MFLCQSWAIYILKEKTNIYSQRGENIYFKGGKNIKKQEKNTFSRESYQKKKINLLLLKDVTARDNPL